MSSKHHRGKTERIRNKVLSEFQKELALQKFQEERPQLWLQSQRVSKLVEVQSQLADEQFPEGSCFLHNGRYDFNDEILPLGSALHAGLIEQSMPLSN